VNVLVLVVDDERDVRIFGENTADLSERIHDAGGGLVVNQRDSVEFSGR